MITKPRVAMYAGSWPQNIGNAFFDLGAEAIIRKILPNAIITRTGGAVHWMFNNSTLTTRSLLGRGIRKLYPDYHSENGNSIEIGGLGQFDLIVFAGMSMTKEFIRNNGRTIIKANQNGAAILGLGTGAASYSTDEAKAFADFFSSLRNSAIITRDRDTLINFSPHLANISRGIDSAFFLPEYFQAPKLIIDDFDVYVFDNTKKPKHLVTDKNIYYAHHDLWGPLPRKYTRQMNTLVSDIPEDYLAMYANCHAVYSDRVHACVASLAYGNSARLFTKSPRKALFEEIGAENIGDRLVKLNADFFGEKKHKHLENVKGIILELLGEKSEKVN